MLGSLGASFILSLDCGFIIICVLMLMWSNSRRKLFLFLRARSFGNGGMIMFLTLLLSCLFVIKRLLLLRLKRGLKLLYPLVKPLRKCMSLLLGALMSMVFSSSIWMGLIELLLLVLVPEVFFVTLLENGIEVSLLM